MRYFTAQLAARIALGLGAVAWFAMSSLSTANAQEISDFAIFGGIEAQVSGSPSASVSGAAVGSNGRVLMAGSATATHGVYGDVGNFTSNAATMAAINVRSVEGNVNTSTTGAIRLGTGAGFSGVSAPFVFAEGDVFLYGGTAISSAVYSTGTVTNWSGNPTTTFENQHPGGFPPLFGADVELPAPNVPASSGCGGDLHITTAVTLAPGDYRNVTTGPGAEVTFTRGRYSFLNLALDSARLRFDLADASPINIHVAGDFDAGQRILEVSAKAPGSGTFIPIRNLTTAAARAAGSLVATEVGNNATLNQSEYLGTLFVPAISGGDDIRVWNGSYIVGALYAAGKIAFSSSDIVYAPPASLAGISGPPTRLDQFAVFSGGKLSISGFTNPTVQNGNAGTNDLVFMASGSSVTDGVYGKNGEFYAATADVINVGANVNYLSVTTDDLRIDDSVTIADSTIGNFHILGAVNITGSTTITGDGYAAGPIDNFPGPGTAHAVVDPSDFPPIFDPSIGFPEAAAPDPYPTCVDDLDLFGTVELAPGDYGRVTDLYNTTLTLRSGTYTFTNLAFNKTDLRFDLSSGTSIVIFVKENFDAGSGIQSLSVKAPSASSYVSVRSLDACASTAAELVYIEVGGEAMLNRSELMGTLYVPNDSANPNWPNVDLALINESYVLGALYTPGQLFLSESQVSFQPSALIGQFSPLPSALTEFVVYGGDNAGLSGNGGSSAIGAPVGSNGDFLVASGTYTSDGVYADTGFFNAQATVASVNVGSAPLGFGVDTLGGDIRVGDDAIVSSASIGNLYAEGDVFLYGGSATQVSGDVFATGDITNYIGLAGEQQHPGFSGALPPLFEHNIAFPDALAPDPYPCGPDYDPSGDVELEPGAYGVLNDHFGSDITLESGTYSFTSMTFNQSDLFLDLSSGVPLIVFIEGQLNTGAGISRVMVKPPGATAYVPMTSLTGCDIDDVAKLIYFEVGDRAVLNASEFLGTLYVTNNRADTGDSFADADLQVINGSDVIGTLYSPGQVMVSESDVIYACSSILKQTVDYDLTLFDVTLPSIDPHASDTTVECDGAGNVGQLSAWRANHGGAEATDLCDALDWSDDFSELSDLCGATGSAEVVFTAADPNGNSANTSATFTIRDTTPPAFATELSDGAAECTGTADDAAAVQAWLDANVAVTATDSCGVATTAHTTSVTDACGGTATTSATFVATDACDNAATSTVTFELTDTTKPVVDTPVDDVVVECDGGGNSTALSAWLDSSGGAEATDACSGATWSNDFAEVESACGATGVANVTFTAADACGNGVDSLGSFTIVDTTAPTVAGVMSTTVECDGGGNTSDFDAWIGVNGGGSASDVCSDTSWSSVASPLTDGCGETGAASVVFTATDACENDTEVSADFIITDTIAPSVATQAANATVQCDGAGNTAALNTWLNSNGGAAAADACSDTGWTNDFVDFEFTCGTAGSTQVAFTVADACGNATMTNATFTIEDNDAPEIDVDVEDVIVECDGSGNLDELSAWLGENGGGEASDICSDTSWSNDFSALTTACGATGAATVAFTAQDACGNGVSASANFTISDTVAPDVTCPAPLTVDNDAGRCDAAVTFDEPTSTDVCSDVDVTTSLASGAVVAVGTTTVTGTGTDACDNAGTCSFEVTVVDSENPVITTGPADQTLVPDCDGTAAVPDLTAEVSAADNCAIDTIVQSPAPGEPLGPGDNEVTVVVTDVHGNTATTSATIHVLELLTTSNLHTWVHWHAECGQGHGSGCGCGQCQGGGNGNGHNSHHQGNKGNGHTSHGNGHGYGHNGGGGNSCGPFCMTHLKFQGDLGFASVGSLPSDIAPTGTTTVAGRVIIRLAGHEVSDQAVEFDVNGGGSRWAYNRAGHAAKVGLRKADVRWGHGPSYDSHEDDAADCDLPRIKSTKIGDATTSLSVNHKETDKPFGVVFSDAAGTTYSMTIAADGSVTGAPANVVVSHEKKKSFRVTLPFRLTPDSAIDVTLAAGASAALTIDPTTNYVAATASVQVQLDQTALSESLCAAGTVTAQSLPLFEAELRLGDGATEHVAFVVVGPTASDWNKKLSDRLWHAKDSASAESCPGYESTAGHGGDHCSGGGSCGHGDGCACGGGGHGSGGSGYSGGGHGHDGGGHSKSAGNKGKRGK